MHKRNKKQIISLLLIYSLFTIILTSCGPKLDYLPPSILTKEDIKQIEINQLFEAYLRYMMYGNYASRHDPPKLKQTYFIKIEKKDPSPAFLARFNDIVPPVKKGSKFKRGKGILLFIRSYTWLDDNTVEIKGGYYHTGLSSSVGPYIWERKQGKWILKSIGILLVS